MSDTWRTVWRGIAPLLSTAGLEALAQALADDDPRLIQGWTVDPGFAPTSQPVTRACPVGYCGWQGEGLTTVVEVLDYFQEKCEQAAARLNEPAVMRWFASGWWDYHDRGYVFRELLPEVTRELTLRACEQRTS
jgi:hypothetical protein